MDRFGRNPLFYAVLYRHEEAARHLIAEGSKIVVLRSNGQASATSAWTHILQAQMFHEQERFPEALDSYQLTLELFEEASVSYRKMQERWAKLVAVMRKAAIKSKEAFAAVAEATDGQEQDQQDQFFGQLRGRYQAGQRSKRLAQDSAMEQARSSRTGTLGYLDSLDKNSRHRDRYDSSATRLSLPLASSGRLPSTGVSPRASQAVSGVEKSADDLEAVMNRYEEKSRQAIENKKSVHRVMNCYEQNPRNRAECESDLMDAYLNSP